MNNPPLDNPPISDRHRPRCTINDCNQLKCPGFTVALRRLQSGTRDGKTPERAAINDRNGKRQKLTLDETPNLQ
jgi:hypothetical protein